MYDEEKSFTTDPAFHMMYQYVVWRQVKRITISNYLLTLTEISEHGQNPSRVLRSPPWQSKKHHSCERPLLFRYLREQKAFPERKLTSLSYLNSLHFH